MARAGHGAASIPPLEWGAAAIGALLVLGMLIYLGVDAFREDTPPDLVAQVMAIRPGSEGWVVEVRVENRGDRTAAQVEVGLAEADVRRTVTLEFVPGHSHRSASIVLATRPTRPPDVRVESFREP